MLKAGSDPESMEVLHLVQEKSEHRTAQLLQVPTRGIANCTGQAVPLGVHQPQAGDKCMLQSKGRGKSGLLGLFLLLTTGKSQTQGA